MNEIDAGKYTLEILNEKGNFAIQITTKEENSCPCCGQKTKNKSFYFSLDFLFKHGMNFADMQYSESIHD